MKIDKKYLKNILNLIKEYFESLRFSRVTLYSDNRAFHLEFNRLNGKIGFLSRKIEHDKKKLEQHKRGYFRVLRRNQRARSEVDKLLKRYNSYEYIYEEDLLKIIDVLNGDRDN